MEFLRLGVQLYRDQPIYFTLGRSSTHKNAATQGKSLKALGYLSRVDLGRPRSIGRVGNWT